MKNTIEFLEDEGIIESLKKTLTVIPKEMSKDIENDPNMKKQQLNWLLFEFGKKILDENEDEGQNFLEDLLTAVFTDVVDELDLKKENDGNEFLKGLYELFKEMN